MQMIKSTHQNSGLGIVSWNLKRTTFNLIINASNVLLANEMNLDAFCDSFIVIILVLKKWPIFCL